MIFISVISMPMIMDLNALPRLAIPMLVLIWAVIFMQKHELKIPAIVLALIAILFLGQAYLLLSSQAHNQGGVLLGMVWVIVAALLWSMMQVLYTFRHDYYLSFVAIALVWGVLALYVWLGFTGGAALSVFGIALTQDAQGKICGPFANGNVFAILMLCAWLISTVFYSEGKHHSNIFYILSLFFLTLVFTSLARATWLVWLLCMFAILYHQMMQGKRKQASLMVLQVILSLLISFYLVDLAPTASRDMATQVESIARGAGARGILYPAVFEVWKDHLLLGVGFGNLIAHFLTGQAEAFNYVSGISGIGATTNAHNHLLHTVSEAGVIGLALWLLVSYVLLKHVWRCGLNILDQAWLPLNLAFILWLQGLINISMLEPLPYILFFMFLGIGMALNGYEQQEHWVLKRSVSILWVVIIVFLGVQMVVITNNWKLYEKMYWAKAGLERGPLITELIKKEFTFPRAMRQVVFDFEFRHAGRKDWVTIQPLIKKAIYQEEWPVLYQALFYSYLVEEDWTNACSLSIFIRKQHWHRDTNATVYEGVCRGEKKEGFKLGWN